MDNNPEITGSSINDPDAYKALLQVENKINNGELSVFKWKACILSAIFPPIGIYYFVKYFFIVEDDNSKKTALICLFLTVISLAISFWGVRALFTQPVQTVGDGPQFLQELITPENQQILRDLLE